MSVAIVDSSSSDSGMPSVPSSLASNFSFLNTGSAPGSCATMLTLFKAPSRTAQPEGHLRRSFCFPLSGSSPKCPATRHDDRPRFVTRWKSVDETRREVACLDDPSGLEGGPTGGHDSAEALKLEEIGHDVLLPFGQREREIAALLAEDRNARLRERLHSVLGERWPTFERFLAVDRRQMGDREWVRGVRALIEPADGCLWVALSGLLGADGLCQDGDASGTAAEHDWLIQPVKVRRGSRSRSTDSRHRPASVRHHGTFSQQHHYSVDSLSSVFAESDQESCLSMKSESPHTLMEPIEEDGLEVEPVDQAAVDSSPAEDDGEEGVVGLKIVDQAAGSEDELMDKPVAGFTTQQTAHNRGASHGLRYSFGAVKDTGLGLQTNTNCNRSIS